MHDLLTWSRRYISIDGDGCMHPHASQSCMVAQSKLDNEAKQALHTSERERFRPSLAANNINFNSLHCICFICMHQSPTGGYLIIRLDDDDGRNLLVELSKRRSNQNFFLTRFMPLRCHGKKKFMNKNIKDRDNYKCSNIL